MAFIFNFFAVSILLCHVGLQSIHSKQVTLDVITEDVSKFQVTDDTASVSAKDFVALSGQSNETDEGGHSIPLVTGTPFEWSEENVTKEEVEIKEKSSIFFTQSTNSTLRNSEITTSFTYVEDKIEETTNKAANTDVTISLSEGTTLDIDTNNTELMDLQNHTLPEVSNITISSEEYTVNESSRDPRHYSPLPNKEQEDLLMVLKSNCSIINNEIITLNKDLINVDCTIYLRVNFSSENGTQGRILNILEKLTVKPGDLQIVKASNQEESVHINKPNTRHGLILDQETFAYLAVALSFAFLLLLAVIVFGFRCLRKQRPSMDISHFDVKLSNYTLTKIPRVSLSSLDCLQDTDCLDDKSELPAMGSRKCESLTNLDIITHDTYSSDREMKTFGVARPVNNRSGQVSNNVEPRSHLYTERSPIAYENHTFQRYF